jgi:hypothetical protein
VIQKPSDERSAAERIRMCLVEAGYPPDVDDRGNMTSLSTPPHVAYRAWAIATGQTHVSLDEYVAYRLSEQPHQWRAYLSRWGWPAA